MFFNGEQKVDELEKATAFNKCFSSFYSDFPDIFTDFSDGIHNSLDCSLSDCEKALRHSKQGCGPNGISGTVYANTAIPFSVHFLQLAKCATEHGIYPSDWKHSYVKPFFKTGKRSSIESYRPIFFLDKLSMCFERLLFPKLYDIINPKLSDCQFGFRRKKSTTLQLISYLETVYSSLDTGQDVYSLYIDFSKAFDKVPHHLLLEKLQKRFGKGGMLLKLIHSYLHKRTQQVILNNVLSPVSNVTSGIPQGSILGPLLFLPSIDDIADLSDYNMLLYADDTKIYSDSLFKLQNASMCLHTWSAENHLPFNADKTQLLCFSNRKNTYFDPVLIFEHKDICFSPNAVKDLGVYFSSNPTWSDYIKNRIKIAFDRYIAIRRCIPKCVPAFTKLKLYKFYILPIIVYASQVWYANLTTIEKLETFQNRILKWAFPTTSSNYKDRLIKGNLLPISLYLQYLDVVLLNKLFKKISIWGVMFMSRKLRRTQEQNVSNYNALSAS